MVANMKTFISWLNESANQNKYDYSDVLKFAKLAKLEDEIKNYSKEELVKGINAESEHKQKDINVIGKKEENLLKIAVAHLREDGKYYSKLKKIEG